jgi:cytochrome c-type biogenesis protein
MMLTGNIHADPLGLLIAFGGGMLSFLSPCVLPLVPGYLSMVSGLSAAELDSLRLSPPVPSGPAALPPLVPVSAAGGSVSVTTVPSPVAAPTATDLRGERARLLRGILLFIAGFTVVFTILGASASALGHLFHTHLPELTRLSG